MSYSPFTFWLQFFYPQYQISILIEAQKPKNPEVHESAIILEFKRPA